MSFFLSISQDPNKLLLVTSNTDKFGKISFIYDSETCYTRGRFFVPIPILKSIFNIDKSILIKSLSLFQYEYVEESFWKKIPQVGGTPLLKNDIAVVNESGLNSISVLFNSQVNTSLFDEMLNIITNISIINAMDKIEKINKEISELMTILPIENRDHTNIYLEVTRKLDKISNDYKIRLFQQL